MGAADTLPDDSTLQYRPPTEDKMPRRLQQRRRKAGASRQTLWSSAGHRNGAIRFTSMSRTIGRPWWSYFASGSEAIPSRCQNASEIGELSGKDLLCFCPERGPCHGDVLLALANPQSDRSRAKPGGQPQHCGGRR